jgi:serine/threonine protein kinase/tetratricopeptide (TPR) repeat protein
MTRTPARPERLGLRRGAVSERQREPIAALGLSSLQTASATVPWGVADADQQTRLAAALAGRYTLERELGRGGMATVYLADDLKHHRKVALKVLRPELGSLLGAERFVREIRVAAGLTHPHILPLYDSGEAAGLLFYVMPYVRGESLRHRLARERQLPVEESVALTRQVAAALEHAHAHGLIHRDIKPENILLHEGVAMVTDFGIALSADADADQRLTGTGLMLGTPHYMSPEQAAGERTLDARSDVYSLGCVLYELLAGEPPFTGPTAQAVIVKRFTTQAQPLRRLRPAVPAGVEAAVLRALSRVPGDRFASAGAFAQALSEPAAASSRSGSIAVLPFRNLSPDPENEFFADGVTEDVIAQLSKIRSLRVIGRGSVARFKDRRETLQEVGATLDVATVLEGSVRRAGSRVRIVSQLIDVDTDRHLWSETYDRELTDIFAIQSDVAVQIASALEAELSHEERRQIRKQPTADMEAYQLYLQGQHCIHQWTGGAVRLGLEHLERAVARDPAYALAYAAMAKAYTDMGLGVVSSLPPEEAFAKALSATQRALELDPGLAEGHAVLGHLKFIREFDWVGAEAELKLAIELNPNSGEAFDIYGLLLSAQERYDEALDAQRRAHELDPLAHRMDLVTTLLRAGRYQEALEAVNKVLAVEPHLPLAHATLGWVHLLSGRADEGVAALRRAVELSPDSTLYRAQLGQAYARSGQTGQARAILADLAEIAKTRFVPPYHPAYVLTGLGEHEQALDLLEQAYEQRAGGIFGIKGSFLFAPLRGHPRFQALLRKMNLT